MMSYIYEVIGRVVVAALRLRYGRQLRTAGVLAVAGALLAGYVLANRDVAEG
jgi:hypothetical protein